MGCLRISNLFTDQMHMDNLVIVQNKFNMDFLTYNAIKKAIPSIWHKILTSNCIIPDHGTGMDQLMQVKKQNPNASEIKQAYLMLLNKVKNDDSKIKLKWEAELDKETYDEIWDMLIVNTNKLTLCTKLCYFQYRLTHRALITNVHRHKWDANVSELCTFCSKSPETYTHLFVNCQETHKLWQNLSKWLYHFCFIEFETNAYDIMFNRYKDSFRQLVNTII